MKLAKFTSIAATSMLIMCFVSLLPSVVRLQNSAIAGTTFAEDFEGGFDGSWEVAWGNGSVDVVDGKLVVYPAAYNETIIVRPIDASGNPLVYDDVLIAGTVAVPNTVGWQVGPVLRAVYQSTGTGGIPESYAVSLGGDGNDLGISNTTDESFTWLGGAEGDALGAISVTRGEIRFEFEANATTLSARIAALEDPAGVAAGTFERTVDDSTHRSGEIGLFIRPWNNPDLAGNLSQGVVFDDVSVTVVPEPQSATISIVGLALCGLLRRRNRYG